MIIKFRIYTIELKHMNALSKRLKLPFTILLVVGGIGLSEWARLMPWLLPALVDFSISPDVILFVFLPTLIFESSLHLDARELRRNLLPVLTAEKNVELPLLLTTLSKVERKKRSAIALKVVGLAERAKHYPRQLSGGQEQRVGIARAIVTDPTLLLCDEPTGDLDRKAGDEILDLLQTLNRVHGKTIVMVTHDPHAADRARRTLHLEKGVLMRET